MPLQIIRQDITKMKVDAIVNTTNEEMVGYSGVDLAVHEGAGPELDRECEKIAPLGLGTAKITKGYNLPAKYVIHTVGPVWQGGGYNEKELLTDCYRNSLNLAKENNCESVAFPLISAGAYGYPKEQAIAIAIDTIKEFLTNNEMLVYLVIFDKSSFYTGNKMMLDIQQYIDDRYADAHTSLRLERSRPLASCRVDADYCASAPQRMAEFKSASLKDFLSLMDESFSQALLRKISESGMSEVECYKKANIDRKLFSKIKNDTGYKPSKPTAIAFAIALGLSLQETKELLEKAGFALSHSSKFDIIIEYFITNNNYDMFDINQALYEFDQPLLGC